MPLHHDLLNLARHLVDRNPGAPIEADLRRGVSTAYYALFHLLVHEATTQLVAITALRPRMARSFDHKIMKSVCQEYAKLRPNPAGLLVTEAGEVVPQQIKEIAREFLALQQARHEADYNTGVTVTHAQADTDVMRAESAFLDWNAIHTDPAAAASHDGSQPLELPKSPCVILPHSRVARPESSKGANVHDPHMHAL